MRRILKMLAAGVLAGAVVQSGQAATPKTTDGFVLLANYRDPLEPIPYALARLGLAGPPKRLDYLQAVPSRHGTSR